MEVLGAVQGDPHQKVVLGQEAAPFLVDEQAVGLEGIGDGTAVDVPARAQLHRAAEEVQPRQSGLSPLEADGAAPVGGLQGLFHHLLQGLQRHEAVAGDRPLLGLVGVEAVLAAHIAHPAGGLEHETQVAHGILSF